MDRWIDRWTNHLLIIYYLLILHQKCFLKNSKTFNFFPCETIVLQSIEVVNLREGLTRKKKKSVNFHTFGLGPPPPKKCET